MLLCSLYVLFVVYVFFMYFDFVLMERFLYVSYLITFWNNYGYYLVLCVSSSFSAPLYSQPICFLLISLRRWEATVFPISVPFPFWLLPGLAAKTSPSTAPCFHLFRSPVISPPILRNFKKIHTFLNPYYPPYYYSFHPISLFSLVAK